MPLHNEYASTDDEDEDLQDDPELDLESIRQACMPSRAISNGHDRDGNDDDEDLQMARDIQSRFAAASSRNEARASDSDSDLELARGIQTRFGGGLVEEEVMMMPFSVLPPENASRDSDDDSDEEFDLLHAIMRRFAVYDRDPTKNLMGTACRDSEQVGASGIASEKEIPSNLFVNRTNASKESPVSVDACNAAQPVTKNVEAHIISQIDCHLPDTPKSANHSFEHLNFPKSAHVFIDAIKKNRGYQKFLRSKLGHIEAKIEENKELMKRVKVLRDFQNTCKRRTGRAFSHKTDPHAQLILVPRSKPPKGTKAKEGKTPAMCYGPFENSHVAHYRMALTRFPVSLHRYKWSDAEKEQLKQGIRQQFQAMMLEHLKFSQLEDPQKSSNSIDEIFASVRDFDITPVMLRTFIPKVNWDQVASMYVAGRTGAECAARWLNWEDPLVNHNPWTVEEDKNLLAAVQEKGLNNWFSVATQLNTGRTPFQCLARYQRSLNACIMKSEWTKEEDSLLRIAVEAYGESDWQNVASTIEGRTGTQCSNRWKKTLNPARQKVGRWGQDEDKRLKVAVTLFGPKNWNKIARFVPGRTQVQCRERWVNCLDPSLNMDEWTEEEDMKLKDAIAEHGYCWSKIAACVPPRTDNQCRRRWKVICPDEVPLLQQAKKIHKLAFISNFVDRESERPALGPNDFNALQIVISETQTEEVASSKTHQKRTSASKVKRSRRKTRDTTVEVFDKPSCSVPENAEPMSMGIGKEVCSNSRVVKKKRKVSKKKVNVANEDPVLLITNGPEVDEMNRARTGDGVVLKQKLKPRKANVSGHRSKDTGVNRTSADKNRVSASRRITSADCANALSNNVHNNFAKRRKLPVVRSASLADCLSSDGTEFDYCTRHVEEGRQPLSPLEKSEDHVIDACVCPSKSKKRKLDVADLDDQVCPLPFDGEKSGLSSNEADENHDNQILGSLLSSSNDRESGRASLVKDGCIVGDNEPRKK